jgi:hypothetical protein
LIENINSDQLASINVDKDFEVEFSKAMHVRLVLAYELKELIVLGF